MGEVLSVEQPAVDAGPAAALVPVQAVNVRAKKVIHLLPGFWTGLKAAAIAEPEDRAEQRIDLADLHRNLVTELVASIRPKVLGGKPGLALKKFLALSEDKKLASLHDQLLYSYEDPQADVVACGDQQANSTAQPNSAFIRDRRYDAIILRKPAKRTRCSAKIDQSFFRAPNRVFLILRSLPGRTDEVAGPNRLSRELGPIFTHDFHRSTYRPDVLVRVGDRSTWAHNVERPVAVQLLNINEDGNCYYSASPLGEAPTPRWLAVAMSLKDGNYVPMDFITFGCRLQLLMTPTTTIRQGETSCRIMRRSHWTTQAKDGIVLVSRDVARNHGWPIEHGDGIDVVPAYQVRFLLRLEDTNWIVFGKGMALLDDTIPGDSICIPEESIKAYDVTGDCESDLLGVDYVVSGERDGKTLVKSTAGRRRSPELRASVLANMWLRVAIQEDEDRRRQAI